MKNKLNEVIISAKEYATTNNCEAFVYKNDEGHYRYCNLEALNYIVNELHKKIQITYNVYQDSLTKKTNPFCEPRVRKL